MKSYYRDEAVAICLGDCREVLPKLRPVDAIVTDPPYGLEFMGQEWDKGVPGVEFWAACLRALKPGGHLLAFGGTRTHHRLWCAIEDAGFEVRDTLMWLYGSGFPKSLNVSKAIDDAAGAERKVVGHRPIAYPDSDVWGIPNRSGRAHQDGSVPIAPNAVEVGGTQPITAPATDAAKQWDGWGTALRPSWEPILLARKPLEGTVAENVLKHGVGGLNIDATRIGSERRINQPGSTRPRRAMGDGWRDDAPPREAEGRWPANVLLDEEAAAQLDEQSGVSSERDRVIRAEASMGYGGSRVPFETRSYGDIGGASRFFYVAKASRAERERNIKGLAPVSGADAVNRKENTAGLQSPRAGAGRTAARVKNPHPTVKPLALMRWLVLLVTPPNGVVLDPFMGSGSTLRAAKDLGRKAIGIEIEEKYAEIAAKRMRQTTLGLSL